MSQEIGIVGPEVRDDNIDGSELVIPIPSDVPLVLLPEEEKKEAPKVEVGTAPKVAPAAAGPKASEQVVESKGHIEGGDGVQVEEIEEEQVLVEEGGSPLEDHLSKTDWFEKQTSGGGKAASVAPTGQNVTTTAADKGSSGRSLTPLWITMGVLAAINIILITILVIWYIRNKRRHSVARTTATPARHKGSKAAVVTRSIETIPSFVAISKPQPAVLVV